MGKLQVFDIALANPQAVYMAGQWIQGTVTVVLAEAMKMRGIHLQFVGGSDVRWTERHTTGSGKNRHTTTRTYRASENYFKQSVVLFGKPQGQTSGDNPTLNPGDYRYPFNFQLPASLPSSFEGAHGNVRYYLKATIDKPWKFDHTCKRVFSVICNLDLNQEPNAALPCEGSDEKMICCLCCASGPIAAHAKLSRQGFVPGEYVFVDANIDNHSSRNVNSSSIELHQLIRFHSTSKTRTTSEVVAKLQRDAVPAHGKDSYSGVPMLIPPVPPTGLVGCNIIDIEHILKFVVDPSGPAMDLEMPFRIIIGTIPLANVASAYAPTAYDSHAYGDPTTPQVPPSMMPPPTDTSPNAPPPSYAQCVGGKYSTKDEEDSEHIRGADEFAPVYPFYSWETPTAPPQGPQYGVQPTAYNPAYPPPEAPGIPAYGAAPPAATEYGGFTYSQPLHGVDVHPPPK